MSGAASPQYPEKTKWVNPSSSSQWMTRRLTKNSKSNLAASLEDSLFSADDTPEFHDPYSDLSLFLSQKIKHEMREQGWMKKWSIKIQEMLLDKIAPEFQKKFPQYRLGVAALKKTWDKISYYTQQLEQQKEAVGNDGLLDATFLIRENLRQYPKISTVSGLHPYQYAHQLALRLSECIAVIDGIRPSMDQLTRTIWAMQRHLLSWTSLQTAKSPYDEYDQFDKMIVKIILDHTTREKTISFSSLEASTQESIRSLFDIPALASQGQLHANISAIVAEKLYFSLPIHNYMTSKERIALSNFIDRHIQSYQLSAPSETVRRIHSLYLLALQLPKDLSKEDLNWAVISNLNFGCIYSKSDIDSKKLQSSIEISKMSQSLFAFISAELIILSSKKITDLTTIQEAIYSFYLEAISLPPSLVEKSDLLEMKIWKHISQQQNLLEKLPYRIGQRIETEVATQLIDNPEQQFGSLVHHTLLAFQKLKELIANKKPIEIERRIRLWCQQGDLLYRCVRFDHELPLLQKILELFHELKKNNPQAAMNSQEFVNKICQNYLQEHPELGYYSAQLFHRAMILYKYAWYTLLSNPEESSVERFILWQQQELQHLPSEEQQQQSLMLIFQDSLPLIPYG